MMASPLALVTPATSEGSPVLESPSQGAGTEGSRFAELLAMLGKAGKGGSRTKAATTARPEAAPKGVVARKTDQDASLTEGLEGESRPRAARKTEKGAVAKTAVPGSPGGQPVAVQATPVNGIPSPGSVLQAVLAGAEGTGDDAPDAVVGDASPASGRGGRLSPHVALSESSPVGPSAAGARGADGTAGLHLPGGPGSTPVPPAPASVAPGAQAQVVPQGLDQAAARVFGAQAAWTGIPTSTAAVVAEVESDSLPAAGPAGTTPAGTTARPGGRTNAAVPAVPAKAAVVSPQGEGHVGVLNLDTLWLFRGDPAYAAAMADATPGVPESPRGVGAVAATTAQGNGLLAGEKSGRDEDARTRLAGTPDPVASLPGPGREAGEPTPATPEVSAASPVVDGSSPAALPGHVGREVARWMQGHTRPLPEGGSQLELRLRPASLGSITIRMAEQNGQLSAQITVSDASVGHAMVKEMPRMADELARHGVSLDSVSVGTSGAGQDSGGAHTQHPYQEAGSARASRRDFSMDSLTLEGVDVAPVSPLAGGGLVNVRA